MTLFGITFQRQHLALWFLVFAIPVLPFVRESYSIFWSSLTLRPLVLATALIFIALSLINSRKETVFYGSPLVITVAGLFLLSSLFSTLSSSIPWQGLVHWLEIAIYTICAFLLHQEIQRSPHFRHILAISLMCTLILVIARLLYGWLNVYDPRNHPWSVQIAFVENIRHLGYVAATLLPLGYAYLFTTNKKYFAAVFIYLCLAWALVFWMGGRATFLALVLASGVFFILKPKTIISILLSALLGLLLAQLFTVSDQSLNLIRLFHYELADKTLDEVSSLRLQIYTQSLSMWWQQAPLFGLGADFFRYTNPAIFHDYIAQPHSFVVEALFSFGLIGAALLTSLCLLLLNHWRRDIQANNHLGFVIGSLSALGVGLIDGVFYHSWAFLTAALVLSLSLSSSQTPLPTQLIKRTIISITVFAVFIVAILSWQIVLSTRSDADEKLIRAVQNMPLYVEPSYWIQHAQENHNKDMAINLARLGVQQSSTPCRYYSYLPLAEQDSLQWCLRKR